MVSQLTLKGAGPLTGRDQSFSIMLRTPKPGHQMQHLYTRDPNAKHHKSPKASGLSPLQKRDLSQYVNGLKSPILLPPNLVEQPISVVPIYLQHKQSAERLEKPRLAVEAINAQQRRYKTIVKSRQLVMDRQPKRAAPVLNRSHASRKQSALSALETNKVNL